MEDSNPTSRYAVLRPTRNTAAASSNVRKSGGTATAGSSIGLTAATPLENSRRHRSSAKYGEPMTRIGARRQTSHPLQRRQPPGRTKVPRPWFCEFENRKCPSHCNMPAEGQFRDAPHVNGHEHPPVDEGEREAVALTAARRRAANAIIERSRRRIWRALRVVRYFGGGGTRRVGSFFSVRARSVSTSSLYCSISRCDGEMRSSG